LCAARAKLDFVSPSVQIRTDVLASLIVHARRDPRIECCGLLAGPAGTITRAYPAENVANDPSTAYEIAAREIVHVAREIRTAGLELLGLYHSHPNGKGEPSPTDIAMAGYPDAAYFIILPGADLERPVRAFSIRDGQVAELEVVQI
jgi:proteasome lid subunit RPN8/RPN11